MPFSPNGYDSGPGSAPGSRAGGNGATVSLALDNMIRSQLKVSDPRNPQEVAGALLNYYRDLPQAASIMQEARGLPFLQGPSPSTSPLVPAQPTSSDTEFNTAKNDVEKALQDLSTNPLTADIVPEMQGWASSIRSAVTEASIAARQGLDPGQRDKVIALRRQLGEYARLARFVGALAPGMNQNYRRLGQALDEVAAVLLVMLGESLASVGFAYGYYLLQIPLSDLRQRRDAAIYALRNFVGMSQQSYNQDDWPRGLNAYRLLYNWLEQQGQGDLRTLLVENELARTMDELIARAQNGTPEGLRALGVTAQLDLERFRRLAIVAPGAMPAFGGGGGGGREGPGPFRRHELADISPPLVSFLEALLLFSDAFRPAGGLRLLRIARPAILFYGLYNPNLLENDTVLLELIMIRGNLATLLDTLFPASGTRSVVPQVLLDMMLTALDRAIDLLAVGSGLGMDQPTEMRAAAYWLIALAIIAVLDGTYTVGWTPLPPGLQLQPNTQVTPAIVALGLSATRTAEMTSEAGTLNQMLPAIALRDPAMARVTHHFENALGRMLRQPNWTEHGIIRAVREELLVQRSLERRWRDLVRTVAPEAGNQDTVFDWLQVIVALAIDFAALHVPHRDEPVELRALPPQFEESLAAIARRF